MSTRASLILALLLVTLPPVSVATALESGTSQGHEQAQCTLCHSFDTAFASAGAASASDDAACLTCHNTMPSGDLDRLGFHGQPGRRCTECHAFHESDRMITAVGSGHLPTDFTNSEGHCAACHSLDGDLDLVSAGHREAAALYHEGLLDLEMLSPSEACLACHSSGSSYLASHLIPVNTPRFNEHASHAYSVPMVPGGGDPVLRIRNVLDPRIRLYDQQIECVTCHDLTSRDEDQLVEFEQRYGLCNGCHEHGMDTGSPEMIAFGR